MSAAPEPKTTVLPPRGGRWRTIALVAIVFLSGIVVGAGGATLVIARNVRQAIQQPEAATERVADRLRRRLDLRPDQAREVRAILTRRQAEMAGIRGEVQPRIRRTLDAMRAEIDAVLDKAQQARWEAVYTDFSQRWLPPVPPARREGANRENPNRDDAKGPREDGKRKRPDLGAS